MTDPIYYRSGYRFQLAEPYVIDAGITGADAGNGWASLKPTGELSISAGYAWDGASGPVRQSPDIIRGSLVHDALYQLIRECGLAAEYRPAADALLREVCLQDGMGHWAAEAIYLAVRSFGALAIDPRAIRPLMTAPTVRCLPSVEAVNID